MGDVGRGIEPRETSLRQVLEGLKPHDHLCLIYESPQERIAAAVPFIAIGLRRGEKCIYVVDTSTADEVRSHLRDEGIDVVAAENAGQLSILHQSNAYTRGGYFDPDRMIAFLTEQTENAVSQGYPAIRVTGEMTWVLRKLPGSEKLLEYEAKLNKDFFPKYPVIAICQYDRWKFDPEIIKGVVMTHPLLIKGNRVYHNFYYVPPDEFLSGKLAEVEVQHWLNNLEREHQMQTSLRQSEERYRALAEQTPVGILVVAEGFRIVYANPAMVKISGYSVEELLSLPPEGVQRLVHPDDRAMVWGRFQERLKGGAPPPHYRYRGIRKDGTVIWLEMHVSPIVYDGNPAVRASIIDITEHIRTEERYETILRTAMDGFWLTDMDGRFLEVNDAYCQMTGYIRGELLNMAITDIEAIETPEETARHIKKIELTGYDRFETRHRCKDGRIIDVEISVRYLPGGDGRMVAFARDITERKRAEEALRLSEERHRTLVENANEAISVVQDGIIKFANAKVTEITGYTVDELNALPPGNLIHPDDRDRVMDYHQRRLRGEPAASEYEFRIIDKQGNIRWLERHAALITWEGKPAAMVLDTDITERKKAEEALRKSEERYRTVLEEVDEGYFEVDLNGNMTFCSDAIVRVLGYSKEELCGMNYRQFLAEEEWDTNFQIFNRVFRTGEPVKWFPGKAIAKDGKRIAIERTILPLRNEKGEIVGFRGVARDVSERKKAEGQRRQLELRAQAASRLASVGEMAAGVAHEINNPLTGVIGYAQLLLSRTDLPDNVKRDLKIINDGAQRVANIVRRLLAFSRQIRPERRPVNINQLIESTLALRAYSLRTSNIEVTTRLDPYLPDTVADPGQIQQVLLNLIVNAEQAIHEVHRKGKLTITTRNRGSFIEIKVRDNGPGIKPEIMDRIFDPFFTTRPAVGGTGLGLSLCYGIVTEHNGRIYAESRPGKGATFTVELPVITQAPQHVQLPIELKTQLAGARILVVDDEPVIREFVATALGNQGCQVDTAARAEEALGKIRGQEYHLLLVDVKMPGMSGVQLYRRIRQIDRSLACRMIFITGDVISPETDRFLARTECLSLAKPFTAAELVERVGVALAGRR